jgi:nitrous oxidase accessory protein NosD
MIQSRKCFVATVLGASTFGGPALAAIVHVPEEQPTIQDAVGVASAGDVIEVGPGNHCGATLDKPLRLVGRGHPTIVGCDGGPALANGTRIGFFLPGVNGDSAASGSAIVGFTFDGRGVSNANLDPIALGVFGRFANDVVVERNRFLGTVQAVTNTAGDRWTIAHNTVTGLTLFDCTRFCAGGDGIVVQIARGALAAPGGSAAAVNRPEGNVVEHNRVDGTIPDGFDVFNMAGILVFAADGTTVVHNDVAIPDNPTANALGEGILVTNVCCGEATPLLPGARNTIVAFNDGRDSELGVVVDGTGGENTEGLVLEHNRGLVVVEGVELTSQRRGAMRTAVTKHTIF